MGVRGYVFIRLNDKVTAQDCLEIRRKLEFIREVVHIDDVIDIDWFDTLVSVDAPIMVSDVAHKIEKIPGVASARPARVVAGPEW